MTEISTEELAQWLESIMVGPLCLAPLTNAEYNACSDALTEAAARLRSLAEDAERLDYVQGWIEFGHEINCGGGEVEMVDHDNAIAFVGGDLRQAIDKARHD